VNRTPPLSTSNCFNVFEVYSVEDNSTDLTDEMTAQDVQPTPAPPLATPTHQVRLKHWERRLPRKYVIATTPSANSLKIKVEIVTTDTQEAKSVEALLVELTDSSLIGTTYGRTGSLLGPSLVPFQCTMLTVPPMKRDPSVKWWMSFSATETTQSGLTSL
jgi:hypothetical protein